MLLDSPHFIWRTLAVLPCLIDDCGGQQLRRVELADREPLEPSFLPARQAMQLRPAYVPKLDVDAVRAALAEQQDRHWTSLVDSEENTKQHQKRPVTNHSRVTVFTSLSSRNPTNFEWRR